MQEQSMKSVSRASYEKELEKKNLYFIIYNKI